jgi:hypothetical protein
MHDRVDLDIAREQQGTDSNWSMEFVCRYTQGVYAQVRKGDRHLADRLRGVGMKGNAGPPTQFGDLRNRLKHACFVVCQHHANEPRLVRKASRKSVLFDDARGIDRQDVDPVTVSSERRCRFQDAWVLDRRYENITWAPAGQTAQGKIVRFRSAAGKNDAIDRSRATAGPQNLCDGLSGVFQ